MESKYGHADDLYKEFPSVSPHSAAVENVNDQSQAPIDKSKEENLHNLASFFREAGIESTPENIETIGELESEIYDRFIYKTDTPNEKPTTDISNLSREELEVLMVRIQTDSEGGEMESEILVKFLLGDSKESITTENGRKFAHESVYMFYLSDGLQIEDKRFEKL